MLKSLSFLAGVVLAVSASSAAFAADEQEFLSKAIKGDISETALGNLALKKNASTGVKTFAQTLVTDHTSAKSQASALAKQIGLAPPAEPTPEALEAYDKLRGLDGAEFDRQFVAHIVMDHEKDIAEFKQEASSGKGLVAKLAAETVRVLEKRLKMAKSLEGKS